MSDGTPTSTLGVTPEELQHMIENFGNLSPWQRELPIKTPPYEPALKGVTIEFSGLTLDPVNYTIDFMHSTFWFERTLSLDDAVWLSKGRVPVPASVLLTLTDSEIVPQTRYVKMIFEESPQEYGEPCDLVFGKIMNINSIDADATLPTIEIVVDIAGFELVDGVAFLEESNDG